jgi:4-amino-4-deoxy-L-arabinose transferase
MNEYINEKTILFFFGFLFLFVSVVFHVIKKEKFSIAFLFCSALLLFLFACILDPFLNPWDERFHALVAKNLMNHPLMPTLYDKTLVNMAYDRWDRYHIWLHKQPLFLWQIAISYKIFGVNEFALRLPSALLCCANVFALYRSGKILGNSNIGYYAAFLFTSSSYMLQLVSGWQILEHNDVSFIAYISLSIWAWLEYYNSGKKYWIVLIGIFSGFAILCKWMVGLLVYLGWGIYSLISNKFIIKKYWDILLSLLITVIVVLPWQLLILKWYPAEAAKSYNYYSTKHLFEEVDGHGGEWYYHFSIMGDVFGIIAPYLLLPALVFFYLKMENKKMFFSFFIMLLFVYLLFSFAATKMPSFTAILIVPIYISLAFLMDYLIKQYAKIKMSSAISKTLLVILLGWFAFARIDIKSLNETHCIIGQENNCRKVWENNKKIFQNLKLPTHSVIFNVKGRNYVDAMFYTGIPSYEMIPTEEQYLDMKNKNLRIVLFRPLNDSIPSYLKRDSTIIIINDTINVCE